MRNIFLLCFISIIPLVSMSQESGDTRNVDISLGYSTKNFLAANIGVKINNWYPYLSLQCNAATPTRGTKYDSSIISNTEYRSEIYKTGNYYEGVYGVGLGYFFMPNFEMGLSIGYAPIRDYENRHDSSHILSGDGDYYLSTSDGGRISGCGQMSYYFKENFIGRPYVRIAYDNVSSVLFMVGINL